MPDYSTAAFAVNRHQDEKKRDPANAAVHRMALGTRTATLLSDSAAQVGDAEALAVADMMRESARPENIFTADDLHNGDGELFAGYGSLNFVSSRLDPAYMKAASARARRHARASLDRCRPQSGEHLRLVTLTKPRTTDGATFEAKLNLHDAALVLLKKRAWFKRHVRGAVIGTEFTIGADGEPHIHAHILAWSRWINWAELGAEWTDCLTRAAARLGLSVTFDTAHGRAVVDVRLVTAKKRGAGTVGIDDAIQETCKYVVKGSDFESIPPAELCAVERALHRRRMVETFGECNAQRGKANATDKADAERERPYLDKQSTTDGSRDIGAGGRVRREPLRITGARMIREGRRAEWLELMQEIFYQRREWRKRQLAWRFPYAQFRTLDGQVWQGVAR